MKNIKTVEINIDFLNSIEHDPKKFVKALSDALRAGGSFESRTNKKFQDRAHAELAARGAIINQG